MSGPDFPAHSSFVKDLPHEQTGTGAGGADPANLDIAIATGSHVTADRAGEVRHRGAEFRRVLLPIQNTAERVGRVIPPERLWVLTNEYLRDEIVRQLPEIPARQILAEPAQRNTAPAIGLAAHILQSIDPDAVMGVFPADHVIAREGRYRQLVRGAFRSAERGQMVVLGILPRWPETGYGYIEFPRGTEPGSKPVAIRCFHEKPDARTARRYVAAGRFFWNAGMFFWRAGVLLDELRRNLPRTASILAALPAFHDAGFPAKLREAFPLCENISIDYAVMERAQGVA